MRPKAGIAAQKSALPYTALAGDDMPKEMANEDEVNCTAF
jgi:hypothetical protein